MDKAETDQAFFSLVDELDWSETGIHDLESANGAKEMILASLVDHLETFQDIDIRDEDELNATIDVITTCINRDFQHIEGLDFDDEIIASGDTLVIIIDADTHESSAHNLADDIQLRGTLEALTVMEIPALSSLSHIFNPNIDTSEDSPLPTNQFGVAFEIGNAVITSGEEVEPLPEGVYVFLPLNYPQLKLRRRT